MKYIFLDIDGVLNSYFGYEYTTTHKLIDDFHIRNLLILKSLLDNNDNIKIILNSSWGMKCAYSFNHVCEILGIKCLVDKHIYQYGNNKEERVLKYIKENNIDLSDIAIIDDDEFMTDSNLKARYIKIDCHDGLTHRDCVAVSKLLNLEYPDLMM